MNTLQRALLVAEHHHKNQTYDIYPYMYHIHSVVNLAKEHGWGEMIQVIAALHDTLEDTTLSYNDIRKAFGLQVAEAVFALTDELGRNRKERKSKTYPKIRSNPNAVVVKILDRVANLQHSKEYNQRMWKLYIDELPEFIHSIQSDDHPKAVQSAWSYLDEYLMITKR